MTQNSINVTASTGKPVKVNVTAPNSQGAVSLSQDTSAYNAEIAKQWAISDKMVLQEDYSSKYYATKAKDSENSAKNYANVAETVYNNIQDSANGVIADIETARVDAVDNINSTKTTILSDIEFVADGEKEEIRDIIDTGKDELKESIEGIKVITTLEIGDIGIAPLGIDETKGKRRYLNGQVIIQEQYVQFTNKVKSAIALYPTLACTESEWQTTATMTVGGQVGKFVVDDEAGTIRLPKIIMPIQGLTDLSKLGEIVEAGLPTLTTNSTGNHTHTRGTMEITGQLNNEIAKVGSTASGAFSITRGDYTRNPGSGTTDLTNYTLKLKASSSWTGATSSNGEHTHTIAGTSNTVQQEQIQYPYFIQVATGVETEDNIINEIELNNPFSLLDYKYSEYELSNLSWLRSNGQNNSKAVYPAVYDLLLKIYNGTETKAGVSVKLSTGSYTDYDFVINTSNETFRLPIKVKANYFESIAPVVGNGMTLGLTNGTVNGGLSQFSSGSSNANITWTGAYGQPVSTNQLSSDNVVGSLGVTTDATKSGIEAKLTNADLYLYFYVGETVQNANLINAGRIEEKVVDIKAELPHKLNDNQITNCILETPKNVTLLHTSNTFTLKAGSKVIVPNGVGVFDEVEITSDLSYSYAGTGTADVFILYNATSNTITYTNVADSTSGTTAPTGGGLWYDTTNNKVKFYSSGTANAYTYSFPLAIVSMKEGTITGIKQLFNGMGYIGSIKWLDKGVKLLCANGRNEDGTLKNVEVITQKVDIITGGTAQTEYIDFYDATENRVMRISQRRYTLIANSLGELDTYASNYAVAYIVPENKLYWKTVNGAWTHFIGACVGSHVHSDANGTVSELKPRFPFRAVDYNDKAEISGWGMPSNKYIDLTLGASGTTYTAPANGWVFISANVSQAGGYVQIYKNIYSVLQRVVTADTTAICMMPVKKGEAYNMYYTTITKTNMFRFIYAEGEQ